jgi:hypothetical protein
MKVTKTLECCWAKFGVSECTPYVVAASARRHLALHVLQSCSNSVQTFY